MTHVDAYQITVLHETDPTEAKGYAYPGQEANIGEGDLVYMDSSGYFHLAVGNNGSYSPMYIVKSIVGDHPENAPAATTNPGYISATRVCRIKNKSGSAWTIAGKLYIATTYDTSAGNINQADTGNNCVGRAISAYSGIIGIPIYY